MVPSKDGAKIILKKRKFKFIYWRNSVDEVIKTLRGIKWENKNVNINTEIKFIEEHRKNHKKWVVVTPLIKKENNKKNKTAPFLIGNHKIAPIQRNLLKTRINAYNSPEHVIFAKWLTGDLSVKASCTSREISKSRGEINVLLFWPTIPTKDGKPSKKLPVTGFALVMPDKYEGFKEKVWCRKK
jgi:hypothetical protein